MMKQIFYLPYGAKWAYVICKDTDHNDSYEMIFSPDAPFNRWEIWEHRPINQYQLVYADTGMYPPQRIITGNFLPWDVGDIDGDSLTDLLGPNQDGPANPDTIYNVVTTQESPNYLSPPESLSWWYRYANNAAISEPFYFTPDLDGDNKREILFCYDSIYIFENVANNQNNLVYDISAPAWSFTFGEFDLDERKEFVTAWLGSLGRVFVYENTGENQYELVWVDTVGIPNGSDVFSGNDLDGDGKPEFFVCFAWFPGSIADFYLYMWEATGNNTYEKTLLANLQRNIGLDWGAISKCGDIDGDGIEELVWSVGIDVFVYKAIGNNQFQLIWSWHNPTADIVKDAFVNIYDLNRNGYNEIVLSGIFGGSPGYPDYATYIYEVEAVWLRRPNGGETFQGNTQEQIRWQKFYPPRCDSLSLFHSLDNGRNYDTIITGLPGTDSSYLWTVPDTSSDSCKVKIIAYGPGWQYDESDGVFSITPIGIGENTSQTFNHFRFEMLPNPSKGKVSFKIWNAGKKNLSLKIYNLAGELVKSYSLTPNNRQLTTFLWDGKDNYGKKLSAGVYFYRLKTSDGFSETKEFIILE